MYVANEGVFEFIQSCLTIQSRDASLFVQALKCYLAFIKNSCVPEIGAMIGRDLSRARAERQHAGGAVHGGGEPPRDGERDQVFLLLPALRVRIW
mgnify:FL=1